jgi:uncharacterized protein
MPQLLYVFVGLLAGIVSGAFGVGGGIVLVPVFTLFFGLSQHQAQGTALTIMLLPVFLLAVLRYYQEGHVNIPIVIFAAIGFTVGAFFGAHVVQAVPDANLRRAFGILLVLAGLRMAFFK